MEVKLSSNAFSTELDLNVSTVVDSIENVSNVVDGMDYTITNDVVRTEIIEDDSSLDWQDFLTSNIVDEFVFNEEDIGTVEPDPVIIEESNEYPTMYPRKIPKHLSRKIKRKKSDGVPKRPLTAYNIFFKHEYRKVLGEERTVDGKALGYAVLGKTMGKLWKEMDEKERTQYNELARQDAIRYRKDMEDFERRSQGVAQQDQYRKSNIVSQSPNSTDTYSDSAPSYSPSKIRRVSEIPKLNHYRLRCDDTSNKSDCDSDSSSLGSPTPFIPLLRNNRFKIHPSMPKLVPHGWIAASDQQYPTQPVARPSTPSLPRTRDLSSKFDCASLCNGTEVVLKDPCTGVERCYTIEYKCYSMTRKEVNAYVSSYNVGCAQNWNEQHHHPGYATGLSLEQILRTPLPPKSKEVPLPY